METEKEYSGNIKLRMPKSLHEALITKSASEGISLNQYCVYQLSQGLTYSVLNSDSFNSELIRIKKECSKNHNEFIDQIGDLYDRVIKLKPSIKDSLKQLPSSLSSQQILNLEKSFPIIDAKFWGYNLPALKIPSIKIVLEPKESTFYGRKYSEEINKILVNNSQTTLLTSVNVNEILGEPFITDKQRCSQVIYNKTDSFNTLSEETIQICNKLNDSKELSAIFKITLEPTYLLTSLED